MHALYIWTSRNSAHPTRTSLIAHHRCCIMHQVVQGRAANASDDVWSSSTDAVGGPDGQQQSVRVDGETVVLRRNTGAGMARRRGNSADIEAAPSPSPPPPSDFVNDDTRSAHLQLSPFIPSMLQCVVLSSFCDSLFLTADCQSNTNKQTNHWLSSKQANNQTKTTKNLFAVLPSVVSWYDPLR